MNDGIYFVYLESEFNFPDEPKFTKIEARLGFWELENNRLTNIDYARETIKLNDRETLSEAIERGSWYNHVFEDAEEYESPRIICEFVGLRSGDFYDRVYKPLFP